MSRCELKVYGCDLRGTETRISSEDNLHQSSFQTHRSSITIHFLSPKGAQSFALISMYSKCVCTWHCISASCSAALHCCRALPSLSQREFISFSLLLSFLLSSPSDWTSLTLLRLMDSTVGLWVSKSFCRSCTENQIHWSVSVFSILVRNNNNNNNKKNYYYYYYQKQ